MESNLQVGDIVKFKTKEAMEAEFGTNERGVILCDKFFMPWMWQYIQEGKEYTISNITDGCLFLDGFESEKMVITPDMVVAVEMEMDPLFPELAVDTFNRGRGRCKYDINHIAALFENMAVQGDNLDYFNTAEYNIFQEGATTYRVRYYKGKDDDFIARSYIDDTFKINFFHMSDYSLERVSNIVGTVNQLHIEDGRYAIYVHESSYHIYFSELNKDEIFDIYNYISEFRGCKIRYKQGDPINEYVAKCQAQILENERILKSLHRDFKIKKFIEDSLENRKDVLRRKIQNTGNQLSEIEDEAVRIAKVLRDYRKELSYFDLKKDDDDDFISIIKNDTGIIDLKCTGSAMDFTLVKPLIFFELDDFHANKKGTTYSEISEVHKKLMDEIFENQTITLIFEERFRLNLDNFNVSCLDHYKNYDLTYGIPNPHHKYYDCWGEYSSIIRTSLVDNNFSKAYCEAVAAIQGFDLSDGSVWGKFLGDELYGYKDVPCLKINETGEMISIEEYERRNA